MGVGLGGDVNPREYKEPVTVEYVNPDATGDANGVVDETNNDNWMQFTTGWAKISAQGGREVYRAQQIYASATHVLAMPYSEKLSTANTKMRIDHCGRKLNIAHGPTDVDLTRRELRFICEESK